MPAWLDTCWPSWSSTIRTARSHTSGEYLLVVLIMMLHPTQELEPPANSERFNTVTDNFRVISQKHYRLIG